MSLNDFSSWMDENDASYSDGSLMIRMFGNENTPRVINYANGDYDCWNFGESDPWVVTWMQPTDSAVYSNMILAYTMMLTNPGIPMIYYGDEIAMTGGGAPSNQKVMIWDESALNSEQLRLREMIRKLLQIRGENRALTRGSRTTVEVTSDTWLYKMSKEESDLPAIIVAINRADTVANVTIPEGNYTELISETPVTGGEIAIPGRSFFIFRERSD